MGALNRYWLLSLVALLIVVLPRPGEAGPFIAYSMKEAEGRLKRSGRSAPEALEMGGITRIAGMVYDPSHGDLIVIGQANAGEEKTSLDDFVVAIRAMGIHKAWPLVSIDKTAETQATGKQVVRFEGGIASSPLGWDLLAADVILKKIALKLLPSDIWGVRSYFAMSAEYARGKGLEESISTRFWFYPKNRSLATREGVFAIQELRVGVRAQVTGASVNGKPVANLSGVRDAVGEEFAAAMTVAYEDLKGYYPEIGRLKTLFDWVALAEGIQSLPSKPDLRYWLYEYPVPQVTTPRDYPLLRQREEVPVAGQVRLLEVDGGIELRAIVLRLQDGDVTALREAVLQSRPKGPALTWRVPLEGWHIPGTPEAALEEGPMAGAPPTGQERIGAYVTRQIRPLGPSAPGNPGNPGNKGAFLPLPPPPPPPPPPVGLPRLELTNRLPSQKYSNNVGGVMLQGAARISGSQEARVDLAQGDFSLIVEGQKARLAPEVFRKFVTALWAVYYSKQDPGISLDPIGPGIDKHLVRYIGKVIGSDVGRVMREADYLMKKWAVGTERPSIRGFKDVDDLMAGHGFRYLGASRRFWFVPEDMRFKSGNGLLLFEGGRMAVKTEYVIQNKGVKAEPADEAFARFLTDHYHREIAEKYPVYQDLFEYAKLVSLAKYLKENGVPLFWFLMANQDLVITKDSPGTVDALAKGSKHFEGIEIQGGVDLRSEGKYVYDPQAVKAIDEAVARFPSGASSATGLSADPTRVSLTPEPFSFDLEKQSYSVLPQHSLTSGKDRRGIRYQTDLALRHDGEPGLELVRYYNPRRPEAGEFGKGWRLLVPYRIKPTGSATREFLNAVIPEKMAVENLLTGEQEVLAFSADRYAIAGYVPEKLASSQLIGLFILSDASYRLADKLGNEFQFDPAGCLTDMIFSPDHQVHFDYLDSFTTAFERAPYRVRPAADPEQVRFLNARIPRQMKVEDLVHGGSEVLTFSDSDPLAGYRPAEAGKSRFQILAWMSDGSFRLLDKAGNETAFSSSGEFDRMAASPERPMVRAISQGEQKVSFAYTLDPSGEIRIASAHLSEGREGKPTYVVHYQYDGEGRLASVKRSGNPVARLQDRPEDRGAVAMR